MKRSISDITDEAAVEKEALGPAQSMLWSSAVKPASYLIPGLVALFTCVVFSPALRNDFVNWDDWKNLVENPNFRGLGWSHLRWMFTTFHLGHYQPLSWLSFGIDYLLWGMEPFGYHLTNILLHAANAVLFYFLSLRLLAIAAPISGVIVLQLAAGFSALFFAVHPLRVESVAWATERRERPFGFLSSPDGARLSEGGESGNGQEELVALDDCGSGALLFFIALQSQRHDASPGAAGLGRLPAPPPRRSPQPMVRRGGTACMA